MDVLTVPILCLAVYKDSDIGAVYRRSRPSASGLDPEAVHPSADGTGTTSVADYLDVCEAGET